MKTTGNTILITGGSQGIGYALAVKFMALQNTVIITGRSEQALRHISEAHPGIITVCVDLSKRDGVEALVRFIENEHSTLNVLINNAGVQFSYDFLEEPELIYKIAYETQVNLLAPLTLTALLLPTLEMNVAPAVVNISSGLGVVPKKQAPVYCSTKAALHIFSKALRYQLSSTRVFDVFPPLVDTAMTAGRGRGKITPQQFADAFVRGFARDVYEMNIGKTKLLRVLHRFMPPLADRIVNAG